MIKVRKATIDDLDTIVRFNINLAKETENKVLNEKTVTNGVEYLLEHSNYGIYHVALIDEQIVGQVMYTYEWSDWRCGVFLWIQSVYVHRDFRQRGVFKELYSCVKSICDSDKHCCGIRLYAENDNNTAQATYQSLGMDKCHYSMFEYIKNL